MHFDVSGWLSRLKPTLHQREPGQIIVLFALFVVVLMVLAGSAYDYASIVADDAQLQNSVDAAALAGSNALAQSAGQAGVTPVATAQAVTYAYLAQNGVVAGSGTTINMTFPTSTAIPGNPTPVVGQYENINLTVTRNHPTAFWPLIGINSVQMQDTGSAHSARGMVDVMLTLDTTGSEVISGSLGSIQQAVGAFITTMSPSTTDPRGPKIGIARFAGIQCQYDIYANYNVGCVDDYAVLTPLTDDRTILNAVANGPSGSPCPTGAYAAGGCPIQHLYYRASDRAKSVDPIHDPYMPWGSGGSQKWAPGYTGTKLPNGFTAVGMSGTTITSGAGTKYAWDSTNGGRVDSTPNTAMNARKVLVLMTDGKNENWPTPGPGSPEDPATYDTNVVGMANRLRNGADGIAGNYDDVEIYVVGYFCTPYGSNQFCLGALADTLPHGCPGPVYPPPGTIPSAIDDLLNSVASKSTPGSCDHYYPLSKSEPAGLAGLFQSLAGRISRGQLTL
jgi:Flp pilus assembly protein TadG